MHNARATAERLNVADTVKVQWQAYLGPGTVLISDMGRALMTFVADSSARHDALCGATSSMIAAVRYGSSGIHSATPTARQLLTVAAAKHGLTLRDLPAGINLFKSALVESDGTLCLAGDPAAGDGRRAARRPRRDRDARQRPAPARRTAPVHVLDRAGHGVVGRACWTRRFVPDVEP